MVKHLRCLEGDTLKESPHTNLILFKMDVHERINTERGRETEELSGA